MKMLLENYDDTQTKTRTTTAEIHLKTTSYSSPDFDQFYGWIRSPFNFHPENSAYLVVFERDINEGGLVVTIPKLKGVVTEGDNPEEAFKYLVDALEGWAKVAKDKELEIPIPDGTVG